MSRSQILANIRANQPKDERPLPELNQFPVRSLEPLEQFKTILSTIGGKVVTLRTLAAIRQYVQDHPYPGRVVSSIPELADWTEAIPAGDPHALADVELCILSGSFGVAENGAIWVSETNYGPQRVAPFICQHLAIVLSAQHICANMHEAYQRLQGAAYGFGVFIAGPSKTADIEQSLVLGAHGARTMTAFLIEN